MKLASLNLGRDGQLVVVDSLMQRCATAADIAPTLQAALDNWDGCKTPLQDLFNQLQTGQITGQPITAAACASPLPRASLRREERRRLASGAGAGGDGVSGLGELRHWAGGVITSGGGELRHQAGGGDEVEEPHVLKVLAPN